ncbi:MAG: cation:proton antiporter [Candidatus Aminicenantes bacterium]|nr:cation:proton antiporter [Candidatus Aminicenantes bacterium]
MSYYFILLLCLVIFISYFFDITSRYTKVPSVFFLFIGGMILRQTFRYTKWTMMEYDYILSVLGIMSLILIVLEGTLDLSLTKGKIRVVISSFIMVLVPLLLFMAIFISVYTGFFKIEFRKVMINLLPLAIISGAIAIPSATGLKDTEREFIIYETSLSEIIGILLFDSLLHRELSIKSFLVHVPLEIVVALIGSVIVSAFLAYLINKIDHHVKYITIITVITLVFVVAKLIRWPSLIVVMIFGLVMNNYHIYETEKIKKIIKFEEFEKNLVQFKQITKELSFLLRSFFFLFLGLSTPFSALLNKKDLLLSVSACFFIYGIRWLCLKYLIRKALSPLLFYAPRGLITIVLFMNIPEAYRLPFITQGVIMQVVFLTILLMVVGNLTYNKKTIATERAGFNFTQRDNEIGFS